MPAGAVWWPGLPPGHQTTFSQFSIVEIEPQTLLLQDTAGRLRIGERVLDEIVGLGGEVLVHSVGLPIGGTCAHDPAEISLVARIAHAVGAPYVSDHLAWNHWADRAFTGFLLPPMGTRDAVEVAVGNICELRDALGFQIAIEPGVNYQPTNSAEMPDGTFVAEIAERADCLIVLDLHNARCNERNGRQPVTEFFDQLPLDRVVEIHLADGFAHNGVWLDAHSGLPDADLVALLAAVRPRLANLRGVIVEIVPPLLARLDPAELASFIASINEPTSPPAMPASTPAERRSAAPAAVARVRTWEQGWLNPMRARGSVRGRDVFELLATRARLSAVATAFPHTTAATTDQDVAELFAVLRDTPAQRWGSTEATQAALHLAGRLSPTAAELLAVELAELHDALD